MVKKLLAVVAVALVGFLGFVASRPADFRIERKVTVPAPADIVFAQIQDFHAWEAWSPWAKLDPSMKTDYAGAPQGKGAIYSWEGNDKVGKGRMTITDVVPNQSVTINLEFLAPWEATNGTLFALNSQGPNTEVSWSMTGHNSFPAKMAGVFMDMDKLVGSDFERGLSDLSKKSVAVAREQAAAAEAAAAAAAAANVEGAGSDAGTPVP